jgi:hypothetical protein
LAKAYLVCDTKIFNKDDFLVPIQQKLIEDEGSSEISIKINKKNFHLSFDQYLCHHDYIHNKSGIVYGKRFTKYFEPIDFYTYYKEESNLSFIQAKSDVALDFIRQLNDTKYYQFEPIKIDFKMMLPLITEVSGAWIANLKRAHLKTAGYFGPNVHKSEEYKEAASEGNVSSIQMKFISENNKEEYYIAITQKGSIVLYDSFQTIEKELEIVYEVYNKLIYPHL